MLHLAVGGLYLFVFHTVRQIILDLHARRLRLHAQVHILGDQRNESSGIAVAHPHRRGEDAVVLYVVLEEFPELRGERMVGLQPDVTQTLAYGQAVLSERLMLRNTIYVPQEMPGVVCEGVVALLELVQFLHYGDRDHQMVVLEMTYCIVVVQDDVRVQHEDLGFSHNRSY